MTTPNKNAKKPVIRIAGHEIAVEAPKEIVREDNVTLGTMWPVMCHMKLSGRQSQSQAADTFLHEALHFISYNRQINLSEEQVTQLGSGLFEFIMHNPEIFGTEFLTNVTTLLDQAKAPVFKDSEENA